jgi:hypothetical protein
MYEIRVVRDDCPKCDLESFPYDHHRTAGTLGINPCLAMSNHKIVIGNSSCMKYDPLSMGSLD